VRRHITVQLVVLLVTPLLLAVAFVSARVPQQSPSALVPDVPDHWVAFGADLEQIDEKGDVSSGRVYRAGDGSTRFETGTGRAPAVIALIGIQNFTQRASYRWSRRTGWTAGPLQVPLQGIRPHQARADAFAPTSETLEGFRLVKTSNASSTIWFAPQLNMYPVAHEVYDCGTPGVTCRMTLRHIQLGEPPAALFEQPAER
jgi:hypothetical protein